MNLYCYTHCIELRSNLVDTKSNYNAISIGLEEKTENSNSSFIQNPVQDQLKVVA